MKADLLIRTDGSIIGLHTDLIDLSVLGRLTIERATQIEFSNCHQVWCVLVDGKTKHRNKSRDECLRWEQEYMIREIEKKEELWDTAVKKISTC